MMDRAKGALGIALMVVLCGVSSFAGETLRPERPQGPYSFDIRRSSESLVESLTDRFRFSQGRVALVRPGAVLVQVKEGELPLGLEVLVYRPGRPIVDKETGKVYPGFDAPVALVQIKRKRGGLFEAQVVKGRRRIRKGFKVKPPQLVYVKLASAKVEGDVSVDPKELNTVLGFALGESLYFKVMEEQETLPKGAYGVSLQPVVTPGGNLPVLGCKVKSLVTGRSLFAVQENLQLVKTASYKDILQKKTLMESGEWGGYEMALASRVFKGKVMSVAVGDVDGDGSQELLLLGTKDLRVYKIKGKEFQEKYRYKLRHRGAYAHRYMRLDVADINGNGVPEIFITHMVEDLISGCITPHLESMVLEFNGKKLKPLKKKMPYYLMVVKESVGGKGPVLLAQRAGEKKPYEGPVLQLAWRDGSYVPLKKPVYPFISKLDHVYGFLWDDFNMDGKREVALIDDDGYLTVYNSRGEPLWESPEGLGVVKYDMFFQTPMFPRIPAEKEFNPEDVAEKRYLPRRLATAYLKGEGRVALFTVVNDIPSFMLAGIKLEAPWQGINGRAIKLAFVGSGKAYGAYFDILWETPKFKDLYAQDLGLGDINGDGTLDLVLLSYNKKIGKVRVDIYPVPGI